MQKIVFALLIGGIFGIGIAVSGMANPAKVLNFFDLAGTWDPSLALVMAAALAVTAVGYRIVFARRGTPVCATSFDLPANRRIDTPLVVGSAVFGIGWGIAGFCPGGAIPALGLGHPETLIFVASMAVGIAATRMFRNRAAARPAAMRA